VPAPKIAVDYPYSYAHRSGEELRIVLDLAPPHDLTPTWPDGEGPILRLRHEGRTVRTPATLAEHGRWLRLDATVPWTRLRPGVWNLAVRLPQGGGLRPLQARLLVSRKRPVALLPGPAPRTRMAPPRPEPSAARRAADATLDLLPERHAQRLLSAARATYRRVSR
jgi:hypothetical protein